MGRLDRPGDDETMLQKKTIHPGCFPDEWKRKSARQLMIPVFLLSTKELLFTIWNNKYRIRVNHNKIN
jgi:hypothetical protein